MWKREKIQKMLREGMIGLFEEIRKDWEELKERFEVLRGSL